MRRSCAVGGRADHRAPSSHAGKLDTYLSGRATPVTSPVKLGLRPVENGTIAALTAAKLQL